MVSLGGMLIFQLFQACQMGLYTFVLAFCSCPGLWVYYTLCKDAGTCDCLP